VIDKKLLRQGVEALGLSITDKQINLMDDFCDILAEANKELNLTRIVLPEKILTDHILDSLSCLCVYEPKKDAKILDIGTGAGFPGIPIAILRPDLKCVLMDSTKKKLDFINMATKKLGIKNVVTLCGRGEEISHDLKHREIYDVVYARAVSEMRILSETAIPYLKLGGMFIAQKSVDCMEEVRTAKPIIGELGGLCEEVKIIKIPISDIERSLILIRKQRKTHIRFPRPYRVIKGKVK